jgi:excisionase family DNA binding protein
MIPDRDELNRLRTVVREAPLASLADIGAALRAAEIELALRLQTVGAQHDPGGTAAPDADEVLSLEEVARLLRRHPDTVRKMAKRGEIPTVPLGKRALGVRRQSLRQWQIRRERRTIVAGR